MTTKRLFVLAPIVAGALLLSALMIGLGIANSVHAQQVDLTPQ